MAATVSLLGTATFNTTSGTKTVTATPAVGDLIVIVTAHSGNTSTAAPTDNSAGGGGTYTVINTAVKATSADTMKVWVRSALISSATSTVFTHAPGTTTGGGLAVLRIQGMDKAGATAVVRSAIQSNIASGTPAPVLGAVPSATNPIITAVFNATSPAGITARTGYTRSVNLGYATPTTGLAVAHDDAGETSATITWGSSSATAFASIAVELDARVTHATTGTLAGQGSAVVGSAVHQALHTSTGTLSGPGATLAGAADREAAAIPHETTGALAGAGASVVGAATNFRAFATSGTLTGQGATLAGAADHEPQALPHVASGDLLGAGATVDGAATHQALHLTSGVLSATGSVLSASAARWHEFSTSGQLTTQGAVLAGQADTEPQALAHVASGSLVGQGSAMTGDADREDNPNPPPLEAPGDGVDPRWTKQQRKARDRRLEQERQEREKLRKVIEQAVDPIEAKTAEVEIQAPRQVTVKPATGPVIPITVPAAFDAAEVSRMIVAILSQAGIESSQTAQARSEQEARRQEEENHQARQRKRRREEEFFLMM